MALALTLVRGAVAGLGKRPSPAAELPPTVLTRSAVRVDPARLAAYARVCGFAPDPRADARAGAEAGGAGAELGRDGAELGGDGAGLGAEAGAGAVLPLTYPHVLGFPLAARIMAARAFPLPLMGLVHTSIDIRASRPLTAGDRPDLVVYADGLRAHRRGTEVVMVTQARLGGRTVWSDRSTYLARHRVDEAAAAARADAAEPPEPAGPAGPAGPLPEVARWRLGADLGRRHARVTGDWNPIHLYPWTARPLGFPRAIVHGMWTVARCVAAAGPDVTHLAASFRRPIPLPAEVSYAARGARFEVRSAHDVHVTGTFDR
jgi:acyl dehydratase